MKYKPSAKQAFRLCICIAAGTLVLSCTKSRDSQLDAGLREYVNNIKAIDVHAHPLSYVAEGAPADSEYDALPLDGLPPFPVPYGLRPENPHYREAQQALYGLGSASSDGAYQQSLKKARTDLRKAKGEHFAVWVLDQIGIEIMLANRIAMGPGLPVSRFRWVAFVDALMLPLDGQNEATRTPDTHALYPLETRLLKRYLNDLQLTKIPATLEAYESQVVVPTLEHQQAAGAVSIKFEAAYLRSLDFEPADVAAARAVYAKYSTGGARRLATR